MQTKLLTARLLHCLRDGGVVVDAMYLYGSHARGQASQYSDIDILVVSRSFSDKGFWRRCTLLASALETVPEPVQIYPVTPTEFSRPEPGGFIEAIRPDLRPLYRRKGKRRKTTTGSNR